MKTAEDFKEDLKADEDTPSENEQNNDVENPCARELCVVSLCDQSDDECDEGAPESVPVAPEKRKRSNRHRRSRRKRMEEEQWNADKLQILYLVSMVMACFYIFQSILIFVPPKREEFIYYSVCIAVFGFIGVCALNLKLVIDVSVHVHLLALRTYILLLTGAFLFGLVHLVDQIMDLDCVLCDDESVHIKEFLVFAFVRSLFLSVGMLFVCLYVHNYEMQHINQLRRNQSRQRRRNRASKRLEPAQNDGENVEPREAETSSGEKKRISEAPFSL